METRSYEQIKFEALEAYKGIYKDSLAFDLAKVGKADRMKLLEDEEYLAETKSIKASLYAKQIKIINNVINLEYSDTEKGNNASEVLKALEMRDKLLFKDLNIEADESNALNVVMIEMDREAFEKMETVTVSITDANQSNLSLEIPEEEV